VKGSAGQFTALCPGHDDKANSLSVKQGDKGIILKCHAGCSTENICAAMELRVSDLFDAPLEKKTRSRIVATYDYVDQDGALIYQVVRKEPKTFLQRQPDPAKPGDWIWNLKGVERVLYNLPAVMAAIAENKKIFLCEGEKDVESLRALGLTATTNAGGAAKWQKSYNAVLNQATVIILPDNDLAGREHARTVYRELKDSVILQLPGLKEKGDVSDWIKDGGTKRSLIELARKALENPNEHILPPEPEPEKRQKSNAQPEDKKPYRSLGYNRGHFYFLPLQTKQVHALSPSALSVKANLFAIAPIEYWETHPDYMGSKGTNYTLISSDLIQQCTDTGVFRGDLRRGRGCWYDEGRVVLHCGDHLVVDGTTQDILDLKTSYVYERGVPIHIPHREPVSINRAKAFAALCGMLSFERPLHAKLLAGWVALAPICGALKWRPHIWLTGPAGSGKSWVMANIIGRLGRVSVQVQSSTTEAGIRQSLGSDALPVLFDEAEPEDLRSQMNIQRVLELARQASSENGASIMKGTSGGEAMQFNIRSMFCLASIGVGTRHRADITRFSVLSLSTNHSTSRFEKIQELEAALGADFYSGLCARSVNMAAVIRKNSETFAVAIAEMISDRRMGDQIGHLLGGYYSLHSDDEITLAQAIEYVQQFDLASETLPEDETKDEVQLLNYLMERCVTADIDGKPNSKFAIGELIAFTSSGHTYADKAEKVLQRHGMSARHEEGLYISAKHSQLAELLHGTKFGTNWGLFLRRLKDVEPCTKVVRMNSVLNRCLCIPWSYFEDDEPEIPELNQEEIPF